MTKASIESLVEQKVSEILAARALNAPDPVPTKTISEEVQRRLDCIEKRLEGQEGERTEGLSYLLMAKQHQARGEDASALKMYELARPYFPDNEKLAGKIERLKEKVAVRRQEETSVAVKPEPLKGSSKDEAPDDHDGDESYHDDGAESAYKASDDDDESSQRGRTRKPKPKRRMRVSSPDPLTQEDGHNDAMTPRTRHLLDVLNTRDVAKIKSLCGLGAKRAEGIVDFLNGEEENEGITLNSWNDLTRLRGVGKKTLETMREGVVV